ncbi:MAG: DUF72 domain-containing protein [Bacteroidetes bacterium]|nr:DUF72 domain-containing protein [Bacteroidota bacterium]
MKFGSINNIKDNINIDLPEDNILYDLNSSNKNLKPNIYIGTSVWADPSFKDILYPKGTKPTDYLSIFSNHFDCIELNSTFYGIPKIERIIKWKDSVNKKFKFCPKVPQTVSHRKNIHEQFQRFDLFLKTISYFENNLGIVFMQLPQYFSPKEFKNLEKFLEQIPPNIDFAIELRHPDWFKEDINKEVMNLFMNKGVIAIITDTLGRRDVLHQNLTSNTIFVRFLGNDLHQTDFIRIKNWNYRIKRWSSKGINNIYFIVHQPKKCFTLNILDFIKEDMKF